MTAKTRKLAGVDWMYCYNRLGEIVGPFSATKFASFFAAIHGSTAAARQPTVDARDVLPLKSFGTAVTANVCNTMYVCMRAFVTRRSYSLSSHECAPVGQTENMCL